MTNAAAKEKNIVLLAAVCVVAAALLAPSPASAARTAPSLLAPSLNTPAASVQLAGGAGEPLPTQPLYTTVDVVTLGGASSLEADQVEAVVARQRYRLHLLSSQLARSHELESAPKTATGVSKWLGADKHLEWRDLRPESLRPSYQGLWTDPTTGLAYARNRWYDTRTASWLSEDPLGPVDSPNLYAFVGWGPHMYVDPMGLDHADYEAARAAKVSRDQWCFLHPEECAADKVHADAALKVGQAVGELAIASAAAETGVGLPGACVLAGHAADLCVTASRELITGTPQRTFTSQAIGGTAEGTGFVSHDTAVLIGEVGDLLVSAFSSASSMNALLRSGLPAKGISVANPRHVEQVLDVDQLDSLITRLGERAVREAEAKRIAAGLTGEQAGAYAEQVFQGYIRGVNNRLAEYGSRYVVEWQPATLPGYGRVPAFVEYPNGTYAFRGSLRLDAALSDATQTITTPAVSADTYPAIVRGYDITVDLTKPEASLKYSGPFGVPVTDIRPR